MNTSDVIAIIAIIVSAIVSVVSVTVSYLNNKNSIYAKRSEMAFEKQIEAFREIADKMGGIRRAIINMPVPSNDDPNSIRYFFSAVEKATLEYHFTYQRYRVFLPSDLDSMLREFTQKAISYYSNQNYSRHGKFIDAINKLEPEIIKIMNEHMGISQKPETKQKNRKS